MKEPQMSRKPINHSEPLIESNPLNSSEPTSMSKPINPSEPTIRSKPGRHSEPNVNSKPTPLSEPNINSKPAPLSEPIRSSKQNILSEPIGTSKPFNNSEVRRPLGRLLTNFYYNSQDTRLKFMNNIRDIIYKVNEGIAFDQVEEKKEQKKYDKKYNDANIPALIEQLLLTDKLSQEDVNYLYKCMDIIKGLPVNKMITCKHCSRKQKVEIQSGGVIGAESQASKLINAFVKSEPIWNVFLSKVKGIGPILAANLIKEFGYCEKAETVSQLWAYTGNHVVNGKAPKREKGKKLTFNLALRTLTWKISDSLMKGNKGYYRQLYDTEKEKQLNRLFEKGFLLENYGKPYEVEEIHLRKGHAHNRALRKIRKHFLAHYRECARTLIGLDAGYCYVESVLHHEHIISYKKVLEMEGGV